jgi:hypothetical protein
LNAGGVGWKHFLQEMIRCCPPTAISKMASALFLYSSDESAFGFMTNEQRKADKVKNVAEFVEDDVELTNEQLQVIRNYTLRGQYSKAYDVACSLLEGSTNTGAKEYFLCGLAKRIGDYDTALVRLSKRYHTIQLVCSFILNWHLHLYHVNITGKLGVWPVQFFAVIKELPRMVFVSVDSL